MNYTTVKINVIADQYILICGKIINVLDLISITLDKCGVTIGYEIVRPKDAAGCGHAYCNLTESNVGCEEWNCSKRSPSYCQRDHHYQPKEEFNLRKELIKIYDQHVNDPVGVSVDEACYTFMELAKQAKQLAEDLKEEFNCSEDYFKQTLEPDSTGDPLSSRGYNEYICKICGWSFIHQYSEIGIRSEVIDKMRDHVHLKHI